MPSRFDSLRSPSEAASSADTNRIVTGRSSQTMWFASSSAFAISPGRHLARKINRRVVGAHVEALGTDVTQPGECRRQHVLPGVLLHVIESSRPVDRAAQANRGRRAIDDVQNPAVLAVHHVEHADVAEHPDIERLAAGSGVERGAIEHERGAAVVRHGIDEIGVELAQVGILVIQSVGHLEMWKFGNLDM